MTKIEEMNIGDIIRFKCGAGHKVCGGIIYEKEGDYLEFRLVYKPCRKYHKRYGPFLKEEIYTCVIRQDDKILPITTWFKLKVIKMLMTGKG